jgi:hypothetical protein
MARPTREQEYLLEQMENTSAALASIKALIDVLGVRLRAVKRRVNGDVDLMRVMEPAIEQWESVIEGLDLAQLYHFSSLEIFQEMRTQANIAEKEGTPVG